MAFTIALLNVRELRDNAKRRRCLTGFEQKPLQFTCYKRFIAPKTLIMYGLPNGDTKLF